MIEPTGHTFFIDEYGTQFESRWQLVNTTLDITTVTRTPYVWGEERRGYYQGTALFRYGIIATHRQVMEITGDGYTIVAEGENSITDYFQTTFPCGSGPTDNFLHHFDCAVSDQALMLVTEGPHWSDPDDDDDVDADLTDL